MPNYRFPRCGRPLPSLAAVTMLAASLASGCATIPVSGRVQEHRALPAAQGAGNGGVNLIVGPPQPGQRPQDVVNNFLLASADSTGNYAHARAYLAPAASRLWHPGSEVTIWAPLALVSGGQHTRPAAGTIVEITGQQRATLTKSGQYLPASPGATSQAQTFTLEQASGGYLIDQLPPLLSRKLLLTSDQFRFVYAPHDLYYYRPGTPQTLVPDPVFIPAQSRYPAQALVNDLLQGPNGALRGATWTAFPPHARLSVVSLGKTAIVHIGVPGATSQARLKAMAAQLVATLTIRSWSPALFQTVELVVNGRFWHPPHQGRLLSPADYPGYLPGWPANPAVYYLTRAGAVQMLGRLAAHGVAVPGLHGTSQVPLARIAISPDGKFLAGIGSNTVYTVGIGTAKPGKGAGSGQLRSPLAGFSFTAISWDGSGDLWVAGRGRHTARLWVLPAGGAKPVRVLLPKYLSPVTALRVYPDGVRAAMIVGRGAHAHLVLAAIIHKGRVFSIGRALPLGPGLLAPSALTWYDADHLLVVSQGSHGTTHVLSEVPVNGDSPVPVPGAPASTVSVAAAGSGIPLYLDLQGGRLVRSYGIGQPWLDSTVGGAPVYPG